MQSVITFSALQFIIGICVTVGSGIYAISKVITSIKSRLSSVETKVQFASEDTTEIAKTLKEISICIFDIKNTQTELRVMMVGSTGNNGMNSTIKALNTDVRELREQFVKLTTQFAMQQE